MLAGGWAARLNGWHDPPKSHFFHPKSHPPQFRAESYRLPGVGQCVTGKYRRAGFIHTFGAQAHNLAVDGIVQIKGITGILVIQDYQVDF